MPDEQILQPGATSSPSKRRRLGLYAVIALVAGVFIFAVAAPIYAASVTVKGHPVFNAGTGSALTITSTLASSGHLTRFNGVTLSLSGTAISGAGFQGSKNTTASFDTSVMNALLQDSAGGTLSTISKTLPTASGAFSVTGTISSGFPTYSRVAKANVTLVETLKPSKDDYIQNAGGNTAFRNAGAATALSVTGGSGNVRRALVNFDMTSVGTNGLISATLKFTVAANATWTGGDTITVRRLNSGTTANWTEGPGLGADSNVVGTGATWNQSTDGNLNNTTKSGTAWTAAGALSDVQAVTATAVNPGSNPVAGTVVSFDVITDVQNGISNGWIIYKTNEASSGTITFTSSEGTIATAPTLVLVYGAATTVSLTEALTASKDDYIQNAGGSTAFRNAGAATTLVVSGGSGAVRRALIAFDLAPMGTTGLVSATLSFKVAATATWTNGDTLTIRRFNSGINWTEGPGLGADSNVVGVGVTYNRVSDSNLHNATNGGTSWPGGVGGLGDAATATATAVHPGSNPPAGTTISFDVTTDVKSGVYNDGGWIIIKTNEATSGNITFVSSEGTAANVPTLTLVYSY